jgi:hypothetical protein
VKPKLEIVPRLPRELDPAAFDAFHEDRVRRDLARVATSPGLFAQWTERARVRFQKASERSVLEHWIAFYDAGQRLLAAKTSMERQKSEYLQLAREHEIKETEKTASMAKLRADIEEHSLRLDKTIYQRQHLERFVEGAVSEATTENQKKLNEADERRQLDTRWELRESLRALHTLIELQHWAQAAARPDFERPLAHRRRAGRGLAVRR